MKLETVKYDAEMLLKTFRGPKQDAPKGASKRFEWTLSDEALQALVDIIPHPDDTPRETWIDVLHGIMGAGGTFEMWDSYAARWKGYDAADTKERWDTAVPGNVRSGGGLLRRMAEEMNAAGFHTWKQKYETSETFNDNAPPPSAEDTEVTMFTVDDFRCVSGEAEFIHVGTGKFWKPANVDANVAPVDVGKKEPKFIKATTWMRSNRYVTELSWLPGKERIVENSSVGVMGVERRLMHSIFNLYVAPPIVSVTDIDATPWLTLVWRLWPDEAEEILLWFAHRVQRPGEKCNHALVLGGAPGIGKDTVLEAVRRAVGVGNCHEIMPSDLKGGFNDYSKSVMLVINELRDEGGMSQYAFYDKSKVLIAAPPYTVTINSKYLKQYVVPNVVGVVMTSNYKQTGLYLPPDDRRHLVCWSDAPAIAEGDTEFAALWKWLEDGGFTHVAAWLRAKDISKFDPKAPPRKTQAFMDIVEAAGSVEERSLKDKLEKMGKPKVLRVSDLKSEIFNDEDENSGLDVWLTEHKFRRVVAEAMERAGYRKVRNKNTTDGRWKISGKNEFVYGRFDVNIDELRVLAKKLTETNTSGNGTA